MLSYEVFMALSLMGVVMLAGSFNLRAIVNAQQGICGSASPNSSAWSCSQWPGIAETHRVPFDLPEAESELVAGIPFGVFRA